MKKNKFCPNCQTKYKSSDFEFCKNCGAKLEEDYGENSLPGGIASSKKERHRTLASWNWVPAILGYAISFILLFILQNILSVVGLLLGLQTWPVPVLIIYNVCYILFVYSPEFLVFVTLGSYGLLLVPFLYVKIKGLSIKELGLDFTDKKEVQKDIAVGVLGGSIMMAISIFVSLLSSSLGYKLYSPFDLYLSDIFSTIGNAPFMAMYPYQYILLVLCMFLIVAPCEEISTRGFLQQGLENSFGKWAGLIITAIIFSALHIILYPQNAVGMGFPSYVGSISAILAIPSYLALSLTLGFLLQIRKYRILTTITAHAIYMTILISLYYVLNYWVYLYW
ncbi:MAG: CPBP family glutamic-type intramembrane protease [Candidatus Jordarchaeaceae archaeon]